MELKLTKEEWKDPFNKLLASLINGDDLNYFTVDKDEKIITTMFGDWNIIFKPDGQWEIF
jgi:hypothetical protein